MNEESLIIRRKAPSCVEVSAAAIPDSRMDAGYFSAELVENDLVLENCGIPIVPLGSVSKTIFYFGAYALTNHIQFTEGPEGIPFLTIKEIRNNSVMLDECRRITQTTHQILTKSQCQPLDVLISMAGTIGVVSIVPLNAGEMNSNQDLAKIRLKDEINPYYVTAYFACPYGQRHMHREAAGAVQKHLYLYNIQTLKVPIPDRRIQDYIGTKLELTERCLDNARVHLRKMQLSLAQVLGVDPFQNVQDDFCSDEHFNIASLRPSCTIVSPKRLDSMIGAHSYEPRHMAVEGSLTSAGVRQCPFSEIALEVINGYDARNFTESGSPYIKVADLKPGRVERSSAQRVGLLPAEIPEKQRIHSGDLLITRKGSFGICAGVTESDEKAIISSEIIRVRLRPEFNADFVAAFLNSAFGRSKFDRVATGTMMVGINHGNLADIRIPCVTIEEQQAVAAQVRSWRKAVENAERLIAEAKSDVEALIEGTLDTGSILKGNLKPPKEEELFQ